MNLVQEQLKTNNFIVQHSRNRKDDDSSETAKRLKNEEINRKKAKN